MKIKLFLSIFILGLLPSLGQAINLYPLKVGNEWTYEVKKFGPYYPCKEGLEVAKMTAQESVGGFSAYRMEICGMSSYVRREGEEVLNYFAVENNWYVSLGNPVDGLKWHEFRCESHWEAIADYASPLGNLKGCFKKIREVPYTHTEVYCDQIGLVNVFIRDMNGNGFEWNLVSKNF